MVLPCFDFLEGDPTSHIGHVVGYYGVAGNICISLVR